ncbi:GLUTAMATE DECARBOXYLASE [Salix purpurea]|uniref:glutamate decarboxylase n=1 Tax=Salix purpurea TaxID=77065 RepID=A0A9Q1AD61_SALPP|nr:GLUTAMATE DECARBOXYLASE [Salix purpurea]
MLVGHKYGLVYAGIGWVIWRNKEDLPEELIFHINYLGADQPTFTLNFSKGSSQVIAQYYQLIRLGYEGYKNIMENCRDNMLVLKQGLEKTGKFNIVSKDNGVPLVAFSLKDNSCHNEFEVSDMLRRFGWIVPAYTMPPDAQHVTVLRVVIREDFSRTLAERLVIDIDKVLHELETLPSRISARIVLANEEKLDAVAEKVKEDQNEIKDIITAWKEVRHGKEEDERCLLENKRMVDRAGVILPFRNFIIYDVELLLLINQIIFVSSLFDVHLLDRVYF